jgi:hypothetical protein
MSTSRKKQPSHTYLRGPFFDQPRRVSPTMANENKALLSDLAGRMSIGASVAVVIGTVIVRIDVDGLPPRLTDVGAKAQVGKGCGPVTAHES